MSSNILVLVDYSEWATSIVPLLKKENTIRICGYLKITISLALEGTEYPLSKIHHFFANINGSKYLSKIDLKHKWSLNNQIIFY